MRLQFRYCTLSLHVAALGREITVSRLAPGTHALVVGARTAKMEKYKDEEAKQERGSGKERQGRRSGARSGPAGSAKMRKNQVIM